MVKTLLAVRDRLADVLGDMGGEDDGALLVAAGAETPAPTGERDEELVVTRLAAHERKPMAQITAGEELRHAVGDDGAPEAVPGLITLGVHTLEVFEVAIDHAEEGRIARAPRPVDARVVGGGTDQDGSLARGPCPGLPNTMLISLALRPGPARGNTICTMSCDIDGVTDELIRHQVWSACVESQDVVVGRHQGAATR